MTYSFAIPGRFPGLNEIIDTARRHRMLSAKQKKAYTTVVMLAIRSAQACHRLPKNAIPRPVSVFIDWFEPNARRDPDNIMAGQKFIFDGMVNAGVLLGDGQKHIQCIVHRFFVDAKNPRVVIGIS